ncbi:hypothetical protein IFM89_003394 [Coptis chinensis]|uniref:Uncharacterized protein n=1 Tax=Coptis chinensis TaxID=261450 RepID=A0A835ME02_9MAGN|nr:hypothetical protein IFM89_003394 [Coptis chinensis]
MEFVETGKLNTQALEDTGFKLKAEVLVTAALREKLFTKDLEIDQLQAELATASRGHDILRCEALDAISSMSHKMKDLELQVSFQLKVNTSAKRVSIACYGYTWNNRCVVYV